MNRLLATLSPRVSRQLLAQCEPVELALGEVLWEPGQRIRQVYFPVDSFCSQLTRVDGHEDFEVALVGNEGMLGIPLLLGVTTSLLQCEVRGPGLAQRMTSTAFLRASKRHASLHNLLHRYLYVLQSQLAQSAVCNGFHALDARLARWLLLADDRAGGRSFHITQEILAQLLGVRRVSVTNAAGVLQKRRLISYHRGEVTVQDRAGLEAAACVCYRHGTDTYRRVLAAAA